MKPGPLASRSDNRLGALEYNRTLKIILELNLRPEWSGGRTGSFELARGTFSFDFPARVINRHRRQFSLAGLVSSYPVNQPAPADILQAISQLTLYRLQEKARQDVRQGPIPQAADRLKNLATHLLSRGEKELAQAVLVEAQHIQDAQEYSREGEKRIKYGTRALLLLPGSGKNL